jgi:hypothetical protein
MHWKPYNEVLNIDELKKCKNMKFIIDTKKNTLFASYESLTNEETMTWKIFVHRLLNDYGNKFKQMPKIDDLLNEK